MEAQSTEDPAKKSAMRMRSNMFDTTLVFFMTFGVIALSMLAILPFSRKHSLRPVRITCDRRSPYPINKQRAHLQRGFKPRSEIIRP